MKRRQCTCNRKLGLSANPRADCMVLIGFIPCTTESISPTALVRLKWHNVQGNCKCHLCTCKIYHFQSYSFNHKQASTKWTRAENHYPEVQSVIINNIVIIFATWNSRFCNIYHLHYENSFHIWNKYIIETH